MKIKKRFLAALTGLAAAFLLVAVPCPAQDPLPARPGRLIVPQPRSAQPVAPLVKPAPPAGGAIADPDTVEPPEPPAPAAFPGLAIPGAAPVIPAAPIVSPQAGAGGLKPEGEKYVSLNFDFADINVVIQTIAELLGLNYILAPGISGKVTIQTSGKVAIADLFFVLEKVLEVNNLAIVKTGDFYKIIPLGSLSKETLETVAPDGTLPRERNIIKLFKLKQITPSEVTRLFGALKSPQGVFIPHDPAGLLFVLDNAAHIKMFSDLLESLDVDLYQDVQVELFPVKNAQAEELAKDLLQVLTAVTTVPGRPAARFKLIPVKAINALLFVTSEASLRGLVTQWIKELDQPATTDAEKIFVYSLNHASAENIVGILRDLYGDKATTTTRTSQPATTAAATAADRARTAARPGVPAAQEPAASRADQVEAVVTGKVKIVADKDTNSLIIQTSPWNYASIIETIKKLDKMPEQVLIEVTIAEISLDDSDTLGLEWSLLSQGHATTGGEPHGFTSTTRNVLNTSGSPAAGLGFSWVLAEANRFTAVLNAYAKASKLNIISRPHIIATNNKEAKIDIGQEVPIITTQTQNTGTTDTNRVDKTIEYRSTGIILTVTPHINENRDVTLDVSQEVSQAQTNVLGGTDSPIIQKRTAKTTMVVRDNETIIIGGLIQEKKERTREGIPWLSRIPILGYLFGSTTDTYAKTELVVLITPRVISNPEEAARITSEYSEQTVILKKGLLKDREKAEKKVGEKTEEKVEEKP